MIEIDHILLNNFIEEGIKEDVGEGDHTSLACIPPDQISRSQLIVKDNGVIAGVQIAKHIFEYLDPNAEFEIIKEDGEEIKYGNIAFYLNCNSRALLKGERLALNTMQRLSGIATLSRKFKKEVDGFSVTILDTRKTTPRLRFLEKWAVKVGGCDNYRDGLYDWIMIKDNHIDAAGSITEAVKRVNRYLHSKNLKRGITVEVRNNDELEEVMFVGNVTRIMLDNFEIEQVEKAVKIIDGKFESEVSGGVQLNAVRRLAETGVNYISVGALTHSAASLDLSLKILH